MAERWTLWTGADVQLGTVVLWPDGQARPIFSRWQMGPDIRLRYRNGGPEGEWRIRADARVPVLVDEDAIDPMVDAMLTLTLAGFTLEPANPNERQNRS